MRIGSVRRTAVLALVAAGLTSTTGCIGSMQLSGKLYTWNKGVSSDKWVQEVVFAALGVTGIYVGATTLDVLVFNSIEFWTGSNPVASSRTELPDGRALIQNASANESGRTLRIEAVKDGVTESTTIVELPNGDQSATVTTRFADGRVETATITRADDGSISLR